MMIKKIAIIFTLALISIGVNAQLPVGSWAIHSPFGGITSIAETKSKVFYLTGGSLFSADKNTHEVRSLNIANDLNGASITGIYPHPDGKYVIVAYTDCNMDRINDDGSVINISDISDALITGNPAINYVGFGKDRIYVATSFGLVTINEKKNETIETMFSPKSVDKVFGVGDLVVIVYDNRIMRAPASEHLVNIDKFDFFTGDTTTWTYGDECVQFGETRLILTHKSGANKKAVAVNIAPDTDRISYSLLKDNNADVVFTHLAPLGKDQAIVYNTNKLYIYGMDHPLNTPQINAMPAALQRQVLSAHDGISKLWAGNANGISMYDASTLSSPRQLGEKFGKTDFVTTNCIRVRAQPSGKLFFWNEDGAGGSTLGFEIKNENLRLSSNLRGSGFNNETPATAVARPMWVAEDPRNPDIIYVGSFSKGLYRFENGQQTYLFTSSNSPLNYYAFHGISYVGFDAYDNLWVAQENANDGTNNLHVISYDELSKPEPSKEAWKNFDFDLLYRTTVGTPLVKSGMMAFARGRWDHTIAFVKQKNTPNIADDELLVVRSFVDQDNKSVTYSHLTALCEDKKGRLWVGTENGVFEITDPSKITSDIATINHLKVPRNDGTGLADYLLDALMISDIAVDASNRKWIATTSAGVYLVGEDGDRIIEHYDVNNSILPSNRVYSVACDPNSSSVFFVTDNGVVEYNSTSAPASEDLSEVYAYPNPVRPDYSGWITVTGLMDNTLVKIADAAGNVFFQGRSEGGMITWDGCNANGDRVKTGVYFVFASHGSGSDSGSESCVTKIMVIN
ncbi:MAG: hypothetical protein K2L97_01665 [Muribaculaceae bacterium]|nr:hypothetical protein [Muribaculaceae bacterium]